MEKVTGSSPVETTIFLSAFSQMKLVCLGLLISYRAFASIGLPQGGDESYRVYETPEFRFVFTPESAHAVKEILRYNQALHKVYAQEFSWSLDEKQNIVLVSGRNQMPNAFATPSPLLWNVHFRGGAPLLSQFASSDWMFSLVSHETAHSYQLNVKAGSASRITKSILGNTDVFWFSFVPIFVHPNVLVPRFFLEGNATWNEARWNKGGRLYSGAVRSFVSALATETDLNPRSLINSPGDFPFGSEKYWLGAEFYRMLEETHQSRANDSLNEQSSSYILPWLLDKNFRRTFSSYGLEAALFNLSAKLREERRTHRLLAPKASQKFLSRTQPSLVRDRVQGEDWIRTLVQETRSERPTLLELKASQNYSLLNWGQEARKIRQRLPQGPIWSGPQGTLRSSSFGPISSKQMQYALFDSQGQSLSGSEGFWVFDRRGDFELKFDMSSSWAAPVLFLNASKWGEISSSARLSVDGDIWWFQQLPGERVLRKNRDFTQAYLKLEGFDAQVVDVCGDEVWFTAPTLTGNALYAFDTLRKQILRVSSSDGILDARCLQGSQLLAVESSSRGYYVFLTERENIQALPQHYVVVETVKDLSSPEPLSPDLEREFEAQTRDYSPWRNLKFSRMNASIQSSSLAWTPALDLQAEFLDPLLLHQIRARVASNSLALKSASLVYLNSIHPLRWGLGIDAWESASLEINSEGKVQLTERNEKHGLSVLLSQLLHQNFYSRTELGLASRYSRGQRDARTQSTTQLSFRYQWREAYTGSFFPYRFYGLQALAEQDSIDLSFSDLLFRTQYDFGSEWVGRLHLEAAQSETRSIWLSPGASSDSFSGLSSRTLGSGYIGQFRSARLVRAEFGKVLHQLGWTPYKFPLGYRRLAPFVFQSLGWVEGGKSGSWESFSELGFGLDLELLINHDIPVVIKIESSKVSGQAPNNSVQLQKVLEF